MKNFKLQGFEKDIHIVFRSAELDAFKFYYQKHPKYENQVAIMAQFLPTFEGPQPQDAITFHEEEELDDIDIDPTLEKELAKTCYVFLVDRSGSMSGRAMDITK